ncbi:hypothetical protein JS533_009810 [Bifidobacterium amazonense]|uniref:Uncharacterized protein n=1 Tax=Bifidobacterium amazonense TaxID=2809027 RepID=A0ABS9VWU5_9BIFI|nr:hypothetical protein [Bifidobacterium amazonense]MCH9276557.1 hypothetical protein [Bifidobacterium amazonense]
MKPETVQAAIKADKTGVIAAAIARATKGYELPWEILAEDIADDAISIAGAAADSLGLPFRAEEELPDESIKEHARSYAWDVEADGAWDASRLTAGWRRLQDFDVAAIKPGRGKERVDEEDIYARPSKHLLRRFLSTVFLRPEALAYGRSGREIWTALLRTVNADKKFREQYPGILDDPRTKLLMELVDLRRR